MKHFIWSHLLLIIGIVAAGVYSGLPAMYTVILLCALEISLSFDNAVVNAKVLTNMEPKWQDRFITYGIPIAVFGMRFLFPISIVAIAADLSLLQTLNIAIETPEVYRMSLELNKQVIFAFGGAFLFMIFLSFFFGEDREHKWITLLEDNKLTNKLNQISHIEVLIALSIGMLLVWYTNSTSVALAYFGGVLLHEAISSLDSLFETENSSGTVMRSGVIGFLYLEVLDASFSFDGVIGAFALTTDIFIIMIGLGVGAMYVRSLTIYLLRKGTLSEYRYLEHGAHYAIGALSIIMFGKMFFHINELLVGSIGIGFILLALGHSIWINKQVSKDESNEEHY